MFNFKDVFILDHAVDMHLPSPIWNFYSVDQLTQNKVPSGRVIDIIGKIMICFTNKVSPRYKDGF